MQYSSYTTMKCLQRACEDAIAHTTKGTIISIDKDDKGLFIRSVDEDGKTLIAVIEGDKFAFYKNGQKVNDCDAEHLIGMSKAILRLAKGEGLMTEDGTAADLGPTPTGHIKNRCVNITNVDEG